MIKDTTVARRYARALFLVTEKRRETVTVLEQIKNLSIKAHASLGCRDFSRVDWMVDRHTHQPYALEVNTIPGFTDHSLLPKAAGQAGLTFPQLCARIVQLTCER